MTMIASEKSRRRKNRAQLGSCDREQKIVAQIAGAKVAVQQEVQWWLSLDRVSLEPAEVLAAVTLKRQAGKEILQKASEHAQPPLRCDNIRCCWFTIPDHLAREEKSR